MKLSRRLFLHFAVGAAAMPAISSIARAAAYPSRPTRIVHGLPAGGAVDLLARVIGQWLQDRLGQPFLVVSRPGANGNLATEAVVRAPPDGYTLLMVSGSSAINAALYRGLGFDLIHDIAPVASIMRSGNVMVVNPSVPAKTVSEFLAYVSANPGKVNMASGGIGSPAHVAGELFKMMTGANMTHVPYRGVPPALNDLLGGQVQVIFSNLPATIEHIRAGRLRALAVTTATRSEVLPDIPTLAEFLPGYESSIFYGVGATKGTPAEIVGRLNREISAALSDPGMVARLGELGGTVLTGTPAEFGKLISDETEKWGKVIKFADIKRE
jgi:tripartite-type tricarboxylate transporter receptor subunit TctC